MKKIFSFLIIFYCINLPGSNAQYEAFDTAKIISPFKIFDNLYYVGNNMVSSYLLTTDKGLILIDALYGKYAEHIPEAIKDLGFDPKNIKYILCSHGHFDHCEGADVIQKMTHARIGMTEPDWDMAEWKTKADYESVNVKLTRDWVIHDGDSLSLGNTTLRFYQTPGHTPGVLSIDFPVRDNKNTYKAFMFGGVGLNFTGIQQTEMYLTSVNRLMMMKGIEVNVSNHPSSGKIFERAKLFNKYKPGKRHPFVDPEAFQAWLIKIKKMAEQKLAEEKKNTG